MKRKNADLEHFKLSDENKLSHILQLDKFCETKQRKINKSIYHQHFL